MKAYGLKLTANVAEYKNCSDILVRANGQDKELYNKQSLNTDDYYASNDEYNIGDAVLVLKSGVFTVGIVTKVIPSEEYIEGSGNVMTLAKIINAVNIKEHLKTKSTNKELTRLNDLLKFKTKLLGDAVEGSDEEKQLKADCVALVKKIGKYKTANNL